MTNVKVVIQSLFDPEGLKKFRKGMSDLDTQVLAPLKGGLVALGGAAVIDLGAASKEALDFGNDTTKALTDFANQTGISRDELDEYKELALDIFSGNIGQDIGDIAQVMADVKNNTGQAGDELKTTTRNALLLRDRFGQDIAKSIDSVDTLMKQFGLTSEEAFDFLAFGLQNGLDKSGDFLDSVGEYSNVFAQGGAGADEFFSILETGNAGGVLGTDKIGDAYKEFSIRLKEIEEVGDNTWNALQLNQDQWINSIREGDMTTTEAFDNMIAAISKIEDPLERNAVGVQFFGTQWEDLGEKIVLGTDLSKRSIEEMAGTTEEAGQAGMDLGATWEAAMRQFQVAAEPAAQEILPLLVDGIKMVGEFLIEAKPIFSEFAENLSNTVGPAMMLVNDAAVRIAQAFGMADKETTGLDLALKTLGAGLDVIVTGIEAIALAAQAAAFTIEFFEERTRDLRNAFSDLKRELTDGNLIEGLSKLGEFTPAGVVSNILGFAEGGVVPGPIGAPQLAVVHGGETITPPNGGGGDSSAFEARVAESLSRIMQQVAANTTNAGLQEFTDDVLVPLMS